MLKKVFTNSKITINKIFPIYPSDISNAGHNMCVSFIGEDMYINDDNKLPRLVELDYVEKRVTLLAVKK